MIEVRKAPVPVSWFWNDEQKTKITGDPWFMSTHKDDWHNFCCMPLTVTLSNGQAVIVRAKK